MSFLDRFELLELLRDGEVQTFRARERATGRALEAHFASSLDLLSGVDPVIDRGEHEGKLYSVTTPLAEPAALDSAGAWRIKQVPSQAGPREPVAQPDPAAAPGDFTRMFQLRQAPEPVAAPVSKPAPAPATASQPGEFTRAFPRVFERPAAGPSATSADTPGPGQPGEFTRMFQQPATIPAAPPAAATVSETPPVPGSPAPASQLRGVLVVIAIVVLSAIAVFILMRRLY